MSPVVRIVEARLGEVAPTKLVVSGLEDPDGFRSVWAPSGASIERVGDRLHATSTIRALTRAAGRGLPRAEATDLIDRVQSAIASWLGPTPEWYVGDHVVRSQAGPALMGVVNVTPDSFSDGGELYPDGHPDAAIEKSRALAADGAFLLDIGGESTSPGSKPVPEGEELNRILPVVQTLSDEGYIVSVDTRNPSVARKAIGAGAVVVNDVSGGTDTGMLQLVAESGAGYVLMHTRGTPENMQELTDYEDVVAEVYEYLEAGIQRCVHAGIERERLAVDPGIGFAKTAQQNLELIAALRQFRGLGRPVMIGVSRKSFIGKVLGEDDPRQRFEGGLACAALATNSGAAVLRVHEVASTSRVTRMVGAVLGARAAAASG